MNADYTPSTETQLLHKALIGHAGNLKAQNLDISSLASLHEEIEIYRRLLKRSQGESNKYYQLCINLQTLSRMALNYENEETDIQEWIAKYPILSELYERVLLCLDSLQHHIDANHRTILAN